MELHLLLYKIKTGANVGSIYRLAHQFDCKKIYTYECALPGKTNTYKIDRHVPIVNVNTLDFLNEIDAYKIAFETGGSEKIPCAIKDNVPVLIAIGNESEGFDQDDLTYFDSIYTLKAVKHSSYNVSHALAIGLYNFYSFHIWD